MLETPTAELELRKTYMEVRRARAAAFTRALNGLRSFVRAGLPKRKEVALKRRPQIDTCLP